MALHIHFTDSNYNKFFVSDFGIGIMQNFLKRLKNNFFTIHSMEVDGEELSYIKRHFANIPITTYSSKCEWNDPVLINFILTNL